MAKKSMKEIGQRKKFLEQGQTDMRERVAHNEKIKAGNETDLPLLIKKRDRELKKVELKLKGLKILDPKFEFETFKEWEAIAKDELEEMAIEIAKQFNGKIESLKAQNMRIDEENAELDGKLKAMLHGKDDNYIG